MLPLRIALVVESAVGGVARHVIDLATRLDANEFACSLYVSLQRPESWSAEIRALSSQGIAVREIPMARIPNAKAIRQLRGWFERDAIDLIHLHSAKAGYLGRKAAETVDIPVVYTPHAFPFQRTTDWRRPIYRIIERRLAERTKHIICVSTGEMAEAIEAGIPEEKLVVINNGLNLSAWSRPTIAEREAARAQLRLGRDEVIIGTMSRLVPQKGIDLLLAAAEELLPDFPEARVLIWGDGPERRALQQMARRLRLKRVRFLGIPDDVRLAYAAMDIYCAPSRWEAGPYATLEAMACGLPIIASDVPGHVDYLGDGESGIIVAPELPGPLDGALRTLLIDADLRETLGHAAHRRVIHEFTVEQMVAETAELYRTVSGRAKQVVTEKDNATTTKLAS